MIHYQLGCMEVWKSVSFWLRLSLVVSLPAHHPGDRASSGPHRSGSRRRQCTLSGRCLQDIILHLTHGCVGLPAAASGTGGQGKAPVNGSSSAAAGGAALGAAHHSGWGGGVGKAEQHATVSHPAIPALTPRIRSLQLQVSVRNAGDVASAAHCGIVHTSVTTAG